jgi:hypothetical protein
VTDDMPKGGSLFIGKGRVVEAGYLPPELPKFRDNPCILTLPRVYTRKRALVNMQRLPQYDFSPRKKPSHLRLELVMDLLHFFQPLPVHLKLQGMISRMIRDGYLARNPINPAYRGALKERLEYFKNERPLYGEFEPTASGFSIAGMSGVGKSTGMKSVLNLHPQVILHNRYKERKFTAIQIVWLRLECPKDGSTTALCAEFFKVVDDLLGTNYAKDYGAKGRNTHELMLFMAIVAAEQHLGVLVIDEIQDLSAAKSGGAAQLLSFFVKLINTIGVPVVLIGTYKAIPFMRSEFRFARRGSGQGDLVWDRNTFDGDWQVFVESLWELQYVKKESPLTIELSEALYEVSYGIADVAIRVYMAAQVRAIETGLERITEDLLRSAYRDDFRLVNHILEILKTGDITPLDDLADVLPPSIIPIYPPAPNSNNSGLKKFGSSDHFHEPSKQNVIQRNRHQPPATTNRKRRINNRDDIGFTPPRLRKSASRKIGPIYEEGDLRLVVANGESTPPSINAYEALKQEGYIRSATEFLE